MKKHTTVDMMGNKGFELFKKFLEKELGEKMLNKTIVRWMSLKIVNGVWETIDIFVDRFDITYMRLCAGCSAVLPSEIRAFMLLKRCECGGR